MTIRAYFHSVRLWRVHFVAMNSGAVNSNLIFKILYDFRQKLYDFRQLLNFTRKKCYDNSTKSGIEKGVFDNDNLHFKETNKQIINPESDPTGRPRDLSIWSGTIVHQHYRYPHSFRHRNFHENAMARDRFWSSIYVFAEIRRRVSYFDTNKMLLHDNLCYYNDTLDNKIYADQ